MTVADVAVSWLAEIDASDYANGTKYAHAIRARKHILPALGDLRLSEIDEYDVRRWARSLPATMGADYFKNIVSSFKKMLEFAVAEGLCESNPVLRARERFPKDMRRKDEQPFEPRPLSDAELERLLPLLPEPQRPFIEFLALTGCRIGEGRGVRWCDVDLKSRPPALTVNHQLDEKRQLQRLKTAASRATVALAPEAVTLLRTQRKRQIARWGLAAARAEAFVFTNDAGLPFTEANVQYHWKKVIGQVTSDRVRRHDLRSTFASRLFERGVPLSVVQMLLRHKSLSTTERYYIRLRGSGQEKLEQMRKALES